MSLVVPGLGRTVTKRPTGAVPSPTEGDTTYAGGSKDFDESTGRYRSGRPGGPGNPTPKPPSGKPGPKEYKDHLRRMKEEKMRRHQKR